MYLLLAKVILTLTLATSAFIHGGAAPTAGGTAAPIGAKPLDTPVAHP